MGLLAGEVAERSECRVAGGVVGVGVGGVGAGVEDAAVGVGEGECGDAPANHR